jgi:hypothetical protein
MSVDLTITVGVGLVVPETDTEFKRWLKKVDPEDEYGFYEALETFLTIPLGISYGYGGSYYDNSTGAYWFTVSRLTTDMDRHDAPAGVHPLNIRSITLLERTALDDIAKQIGLSEPIITPFLSVLWH